ncbi:MAG: hypothetical protein PHN49_08925, partial [Candidatus Omnitrophica bacterium]|nr:hypothetical protein [Candidatus Omnitrophota bacterium]
KASGFMEHAHAMIEKNDRIRGEFYIDQCMNYLIRDGLQVRVFEVDQYASWGKPEDLRVYQYWQSFFDQAAFHPYRRQGVTK